MRNPIANLRRKKMNGHAHGTVAAATVGAHPHTDARHLTAARGIDMNAKPQVIRRASTSAQHDPKVLAWLLLNHPDFQK
jgi:hypothetical protein